MSLTSGLLDEQLCECYRLCLGTYSSSSALLSRKGHCHVASHSVKTDLNYLQFARRPIKSECDHLNADIQSVHLLAGLLGLSFPIT